MTSQPRLLYKPIVRFVAWVGSQRESVRIEIALGMVLLIAVAAYLSEHVVTFSACYLAPVLLIGWTTGVVPGIIIGVCCATAQLLSQILSQGHFDHPFLGIGNAFTQVIVFTAVDVLVARLRQAHDNQAVLARTDFLTSLLNRRAFFEEAEKELERSRRYEIPLTLAYLDCDEFKAVNDRYGHQAGDEVLKTVSIVLRTELRSSDYSARIGGDEFACLLVETNVEAAQLALGKLQSALVAAFHSSPTPGVTFSIGAICFVAAPSSVEEMISSADQAMYQSKQKGKAQTTFLSKEKSLAPRHT